MGTTGWWPPGTEPASSDTYRVAVADEAPRTLTINSQAPHPAATGDNRVAGDLVLATGGVERLRVKGNGEFYVNGKLAATDQDVYRGMRALLGLA